MHYKAPICRFHLANIKLNAGDTVSFNTPQVYTLKHIKPQQGGALLTWQAHCVDCGAVFDYTSGLVIGGGVVRRCEAHRKGAAAVKAAPVARGGVVSVKVVPASADHVSPSTGALIPGAVMDLRGDALADGLNRVAVAASVDFGVLYDDFMKEYRRRKALLRADNVV